ncbi:MAG: hypothetical protein ABSA82_05590 [Thermacetogeniaceae bacterium]
MFGRLGQALGPWGLLAVGVVVGVAASPPLRKGARRLAVLATRGVLSIADEAKKLTEDIKKVAGEAKGELDKLVEEARTVGTEGTAQAE